MCSNIQNLKPYIVREAARMKSIMVPPVFVYKYLFNKVPAVKTSSLSTEFLKLFFESRMTGD
jgi:hypothetical protein